jgi:hypothetical protein
MTRDELFRYFNSEFFSLIFPFGIKAHPQCLGTNFWRLFSEGALELLDRVFSKFYLNLSCTNLMIQSNISTKFTMFSNHHLIDGEFIRKLSHKKYWLIF